MEKARLGELYNTTIKPQLQKQLGIKNVMEVPKITKVVLNVGVKDAISDSKAIQGVLDILTKVSGQVPVKTLAKKSIAGFKLREGMPIGAKVTLRGQRMYEFLDRLINLALPKVRDFQASLMDVEITIWALKNGSFSLRLIMISVARFMASISRSIRQRVLMNEG